jgi:hypothetical protein
MDDRSSGARNPAPPAGRGNNGRSRADVANLSTSELVGRIAQDAQGLVKAEVALARAELRGDLRDLLSRIQRLGTSAAFLFGAAAMLLTSAVHRQAS